MPRVISNQSRFVKSETKRLKQAERLIANTIKARAVVLAPKLTGDLQANGRVLVVNGGLRVKFGDEDVPYARRRHFENKKNPQTLNYLQRAGDSVMKESIKRYVK